MSEEIPEEWLAEFEAAARRSLPERFKYSFIKTYKPVLDDEPYRPFDTMVEYRQWCNENLPECLGYRSDYEKLRETMKQPDPVISIRVAELRDAEEISHVLCACYEGFIRSDGFEEEVVEQLKQVRGSLPCIRDEIAEGGVFVAEVEGRVAGIVSVHGNEIARLYVAPKHQRCGVGTRLFNCAETCIRASGFAHLTLGAAGRSMLPFYEKLGMCFVREKKIVAGPCAGMTVTILEKQLMGDDR
ncbi:MAG: GNAT family N-acetyltransferase [Candidatus Hydrogenedentes bacterium]|nr:GNAT family N-acetyltransferase [Candidatus Hydrogenedentota bacterium]